jgi:hypothetical protein
MKRGAWQPLLRENRGGRKLVLTQSSVQIYNTTRWVAHGVRHGMRVMAGAQMKSLFTSAQASIRFFQYDTH